MRTLLILLASCGGSPISGTWTGLDGTLHVTEDAAALVSRFGGQRYDVELVEGPYSEHAIEVIAGQEIQFRETEDVRTYIANEALRICAFCRSEGEELVCRPVTIEVGPVGIEVDHDCRFVRAGDALVPVEPAVSGSWYAKGDRDFGTCLGEVAPAEAAVESDGVQRSPNTICQRHGYLRCARAFDRACQPIRCSAVADTFLAQCSSAPIL